MHRDLSPDFERFVLDRSTALLRTTVLLVEDRGLAEDLLQTALLRLATRWRSVDTTTYLPVRWEWQQEHSARYDLTWLPPTPENLAQLTTTIPDGFTERR